VDYKFRLSCEIRSSLHAHRSPPLSPVVRPPNSHSIKLCFLVFHFIIKHPPKPAAGVPTLAQKRRVAYPFFPPECVSVCCDTLERLSHCGPCVQTCHRTPLILHPTMEMRPHLKGIIVTYENMFCCRFTSPPV